MFILFLVGIYLVQYIICECIWWLYTYIYRQSKTQFWQHWFIYTWLYCIINLYFQHLEDESFDDKPNFDEKENELRMTQCVTQVKDVKYDASIYFWYSGYNYKWWYQKRKSGFSIKCDDSYPIFIGDGT